MKDYLIVGAGLAGIAFAETALAHGKSVLVFDNDSQHSSATAAGVYNPVILKRFSRLSNAQAQLDAMHEFYSGLKKRLGFDCCVRMPILRRFASVEEQNNWFIAADKEGLSPFLSTKLVSGEYNGIDAPFGFGEVLQTGFVDTKALLEQYRGYLSGMASFQAETFNPSLLGIGTDAITYGTVRARHIIFAEGFGIKSNPFFNYLPLEGTKGELLTIKTDVDLDFIIKAGVFLLPLGNGLYKAGATYNWNDKTEAATAEAREELIGKISEILTGKFEVIDQKAGIRPTVKDRKPLVGTHPQHSRLHVLNGLGTRGVMLGPSMAQLLFNAIENATEIPREVNITRFPRD